MFINNDSIIVLLIISLINNYVYILIWAESTQRKKGDQAVAEITPPMTDNTTLQPPQRYETPMTRYPETQIEHHVELLDLNTKSNHKTGDILINKENSQYYARRKILKFLWRRFTRNSITGYIFDYIFEFRSLLHWGLRKQEMRYL